MDEKQPHKRNTPDELRQKMSEWRRANPEATLTEIELMVEAELARVRQELVAEMVQEVVTAPVAVPDCPECGAAMVKNGQRQRQLQSKEGQTIQLKRQQWRCLACGTTLFPPG